MVHIYIKNHISFLFLFKQLQVRYNSPRAGSSGFFKISAIKGRLLWELLSPLKMKTRKTEPLKGYLSCQQSYFRQDSKFDLFFLYLHWPAAIFTATPKCHIWRDFHIYFCHVSTVQVDPSEDSLYMIPVQIKNSLFQTDTVAEKGGHGDHLETRCSAVCQHHLCDLTHRRVRLCTLAWTGTCQERQQCTKTHAHM